MPLFISYSHKDKEFVDSLAHQLVARNVNIWLDRWELSVGDSIIDKVQEAADGASALLVILSKSSTSSEWCKRELSAGLMRELEERRVVVLPVLLEDCDIPLFARGKLYADFRANQDEGMSVLLESIAKVTNASMARSKEPEYHVDWSIDWGDIHGLIVVYLTYVEQAQNQPYTCLTTVQVVCSPISTLRYHKISKEQGDEFARMDIIKSIMQFLDSKPPLRPILEDEREKVMNLAIDGSTNEEYALRIGSRRLGEDTGRNILLNVTNLISKTYQHMSEVLRSEESNDAKDGSPSNPD